MPKLTVQNAEIKTATVEVKTLTLSGKQVTLSVFKQIEQAELIREDGSLAGDPWGRVNYHPDKCADGWSHLHVVWQDGSELRRSSIPAPRDFRYQSDSLDRFFDAAVLDHFLGGRAILPEGPPTTEVSGVGETLLNGKFNLWGLDVDIEVSRDADAAQRARHEVAVSDNESGRRRSEWNGKVSPSRHDRALRIHQDVIHRLEKSVSQHSGDLAAVAGRVRAEVAREMARRDRVQESWVAVNALPQLFIAI